MIDEFHAALKKPIEDHPVIEFVDVFGGLLGAFGLDLSRLSGARPPLEVDGLETSFPGDSGHTLVYAAITGVKVKATSMTDWSWALSFGRKLIVDESIAYSSGRRRFERPFFTSPPQGLNPDDWRIGLRVYGPKPARDWRVRIELLGWELTRDAFEKISKENING